MAGCKPFQPNEVQKVLSHFQADTALRDKAIFILGIRSGFRISEILSLRLSDVLFNGEVVDRVRVERRYMKGKVSSREVVLHPEAKAALATWINQLKQKETAAPETYLFLSRKGDNKPINRKQYFRILKAASDKAGVTGAIATHSMRKTFANRVYEKLNFDLVKMQKALGHRNISSTIQYLSFRQEDIDDAILAA